MHAHLETFRGGSFRLALVLPNPRCPPRRSELLLERLSISLKCASDVMEPQLEVSASTAIDNSELRTRRRLVRPRTVSKPTKLLTDIETSSSESAPAEGLPKRTTSKSAQRAPQLVEREAFGPTILSESSPFYQPALTDEDLEQDPPGHRSGYVAVIGKPNAGKSTLINALVGQKLSIVTYKPQTTRHRIMGIASDRNYQMILFDTPGVIERKRTKLEERMMAAVVHSIKDSEAIIAVVDSADKPKEALAMFQPGENWSGPPMAVLLNKADLLPEEQVLELKDWYIENCKAEQVWG